MEKEISWQEASNWLFLPLQNAYLQNFVYLNVHPGWVEFVTTEDIKPARFQIWIEPASVSYKSIALSPGSSHFIVERVISGAGKKHF